MGLKSEKNDLFQASQVVIILFYTIFVVMHVVITFMFGWEKWILLPILAAVVASWALYIGGVFKPRQRIWLIASFMMVTYFIYGTHLTSTYDLAIVMASLMVLFITAGMKGTIILCLVTYYITMTYDIIKLVLEGETQFDNLLIARTVMHYCVMAMIAWFSVNTVQKWKDIMDASAKEIDDLQDSTERLNDFLANVSHEIRTPVNAIIGLSGVCIDQEKNPEIEKNMIAVHSAGRKVADQIGDILDFSEIDRRNAVKNCEDYMMSSMMNDIMTDIREMMKEGVELVIDIDSRIPEVMNTDVAKLKKIIKALVSNGMKYTNTGGVYLKISSDPQPYGVNLIIEVSDTGIGMSEAELERVKERFYQSDSGRARTSSGLGLGLPIVSGFVELLGGFMTISSQEGVGTTVRVSIPQTVVDEAYCMSVPAGKKVVLGTYMHFENLSNPTVREYYNAQALGMSRGLGIDILRVDNRDQLVKAATEQSITHLFIGADEYAADKEILEKMAGIMKIFLLSDKSDVLPEESGIKKMEKPFYAFPVIASINAENDDDRPGKGEMKLYGVRALVVDDEPMNLVVAKSIFKRYEMVVDTASSGYEAVEFCRGKGFDIIFMDHMMGGMDGVEAMKKIRSDVKGVNHETPMIALTANAMSSAKQMFLSEGFDGFVSKPIEIEELERTIRRVLPKNLISYVEEDTAEEPADENSSGILEFGAKENSSEVPETTAKEDSTEALEFGPSAEVSTEDGSANDFAKVKESLKAHGVDTEAAMGYFSDDDELYAQLLTQFAEGADERIHKLNGFFEKRDYKNYEVLIHSTKSNTKMIGFTQLSEEARKLEEAAHNLDDAYITANHGTVVDQCKETALFISGLLNLNITFADSPADGSESDVLEFNAADGDVLEFGASGDEVIEFSASEEDEKSEYGKDSDAGALEFGADDEVLEFTPAEGGDQ